MDISWGELNQSNADFKVLSLQNFHGWSILPGFHLDSCYATDCIVFCSKTRLMFESTHVGLNLSNTTR